MSLAKLQTIMNEYPEVRKEFREDPDAALRKYSAFEVPDTGVYRVVVFGLVIVVGIITIGIILPYSLGKEYQELPDVLITIVSTALGALAGMLVPRADYSTTRANPPFPGTPAPPSQPPQGSGEGPGRSPSPGGLQG